jgi:signal peptidase I
VLPDHVALAVVIVTILCRSALCTIVALLLWGVLPGLAGFPTTVVMSGSMSPQLQVGDAVVTHPVDGGHLAVGQVLLFDDPDHDDLLRMHRLATIDEEGRLWTRGDANADADSTPVTADAVHGAAFLRIPFAGLPVSWVRTQQPLPLAVSGLLVLVLLAGVRLGRLLDDPEERRRRRHRGVRLPAVHRAAAVTVTGVVLAGALVAPPSDARAAYSATTQNTANGWTTLCGDVAPTGLGTAPRLSWGYGSGTGANVPDLSGQGDTGLLAGDATRTTCVAGASPSVTVGSGGGGGIIEQASRAYPGDTTIATWFKTSTAGGVLADFGSSNTAAGSTSIDRLLYLRSDGSITFGAATVQVGALMGGVLACTSAPGYADGQWHLAVATWTLSSGCTLTVDNGATVANSPALTLALLGGYTGYWRFGYDIPSTATWAGATPKFIGSLDESQVYGAVLGAGARSAIYARGH